MKPSPGPPAAQPHSDQCDTLTPQPAPENLRQEESLRFLDKILLNYMHLFLLQCLNPENPNVNT